MNSRFIDACLAEINEAVRWYAEQSPKLPECILAELRNAVEKLIPFVGFIIHQGGKTSD